MIISGIIGIVLIIILIIIIIKYTGDFFQEPGAICLVTLLAGLGIICCGIINNGIKSKPKAIDVYRGNTELVIHYEMRDSVLIPIDSVVVFKEK